MPSSVRSQGRDIVVVQDPKLEVKPIHQYVVATAPRLSPQRPLLAFPRNLTFGWFLVTVSCFVGLGSWLVRVKRAPEHMGYSNMTADYDKEDPDHLDQYEGAALFMQFFLLCITQITL